MWGIQTFPLGHCGTTPERVGVCQRSLEGPNVGARTTHKSFSKQVSFEVGLQNSVLHYKSHGLCTAQQNCVHLFGRSKAQE